MNEKKPLLDEWKTLYELTSGLKTIEPWQWLEEQDIFAVQNPETGEIGFVSVMGSIGEHYSVSVYRGEEGLWKFWDFQETDIDDLVYQRILEMPQLQASFEDRDYLYKDDREIIKKLSLTFRGKQSWPMFRSYVPGFVPWFITSSEARFLICALQQTIDVSLRAKDNPSLLRPAEEASYLLRRSVKKGNSIQWQDSIWNEPVPDPKVIDFSIDMITYEKLKNMPSRKIALEADIFMSPGAVHEKDSRPYYPYLLILLETNNGMIVGNELMPPLPDLKSMWAKVPNHIMKLLLNASLKPAHILVSSELLYQLLAPIGDDLNISVEYVEELPISTEARASFIGYIKEKGNFEIDL